MNGKYGPKEYIQTKYIADVRNIYRTRYGQRKLAGNFSHDNSFKKSNMMCKCGLFKEKERHSKNCPVYSDIWDKYSDFKNNKDLVSFYIEVLERRDKINTLEEEDYMD